MNVTLDATIPIKWKKNTFREHFNQRTDTEHGIMVKFLKNIYHMISKRAMYKPVLSFSTVVAFQESELGKPKSSLKLENMREKWSHKHLLQQSR